MDTLQSTAAWHFIVQLLGLHTGPEDLAFSQMAWRTVVVFTWSLLLLNLAYQRVVGRNSGTDVMLLVVLGSVLSRAINGEAAFFPTLGVCVVLVLLHRLLMSAAFRFHFVSIFAKGRDSILVRNGAIDWAAMKRARVTQDDLLQHLRLNGGVSRIEDVQEARLERSGGISVICRPGCGR